MKPETINEIYAKGKELIAFWHDCRLQQIRLESANKRKLAEFKYHCIDDIESKKRRR